MSWLWDYIPDILSVAGFGLFAYGLFQVYEPAAFIGSGALLLVAGWRLAR